MLDSVYYYFIHKILTSLCCFMYRICYCQFLFSTTFFRSEISLHFELPFQNCDRFIHYSFTSWWLLQNIYITWFNVKQQALRPHSLLICPLSFWGTRWRSWLRHCATSQKVAGPDGVIGIFHWHNPSGRTMALGSTQPLTEMSTRNISWG